MDSSIFVSAPFKGVFWHFKVDRRIYLTDTVILIKNPFPIIIHDQKVLSHVLSIISKLTERNLSAGCPKGVVSSDSHKTFLLAF